MRMAVRNLPCRGALPYDGGYGRSVMKAAEEQLAAIGFGRVWSEPVCWRSVRLGAPVPGHDRARSGLEPSCSRSLLRWRDLLARNPGPSPYRISRAG
jgi:hypothetical protein